MTTGWNNRGSFKEHDERMKMFHKSHTNVAMANGPMFNKLALIESMRPLQARYAMAETGGSRLPNGTTDWSALVPALKVAPYRLSSN